MSKLGGEGGGNLDKIQKNSSCSSGERPIHATEVSNQNNQLLKITVMYQFECEGVKNSK